MTELAEIQPTSKPNVIDLLREVGVDVSDWGNWKFGERQASKNPRYCYEWAFVEPGKVVVLNLWYDTMMQEGEEITLQANYRADIATYQKNRQPIWVRRARRIDEALQRAQRDGLPIRVIVTDGNRRKRDDPNAKGSQVHARFLDPEPWMLAEYDWTTGRHKLVRGSTNFVDQYTASDGRNGPPDKVPTSGEAYRRDRRVRDRALTRSRGYCEYCGQRGFPTPSGGVYLETHHIVPLSQGGDDDITNVAALCANDHKQAHFGVERDKIATALLAKFVR